MRFVLCKAIHFCLTYIAKLVNSFCNAIVRPAFGHEVYITTNYTFKVKKETTKSSPVVAATGHSKEQDKGGVRGGPPIKKDDRKEEGYLSPVLPGPAPSARRCGQ